MKELEDENVALNKANKNLQKQIEELSQEEKSTVTLIDDIDETDGNNALHRPLSRY